MLCKSSLIRCVGKKNYLGNGQLLWLNHVFVHASSYPWNLSFDGVLDGALEGIFDGVMDAWNLMVFGR